MLIGEIINHVKDILRLDNYDIHLTDRDVYSIIKKHRAWLIKRENNKNRILKNADIMQTAGCIELIDVDITECCNINTCCTIKRTKDKLPEIVSGDNGPLMGLISSLDKEVILYPTNVRNWQNKRKLSTHRYNKTKYYWISNNYLYTPDVEWDFIAIEAMFDEPVKDCNESESCKSMQENSFMCPEYLLGELINGCLQDLNTHLQIPNQEKLDKNENTK